jgi:hypothetical protein
MRQATVNLSPSQVSPIQAKPVQAQPIQAQPIQAQPIQAQPIQVQVDSVPVDSVPVKTPHKNTPLAFGTQIADSFAVRGCWVPGTLDRVILQRQDTPVLLEVHSRRVHQLFGRGAMDPLYLTGKSHFECTSDQWSALKP